MKLAMSLSQVLNEFSQNCQMFLKVQQKERLGYI